MSRDVRNMANDGSSLAEPADLESLIGVGISAHMAVGSVSGSRLEVFRFLGRLDIELQNRMKKREDILLIPKRKALYEADSVREIRWRFQP